MVERDVETNSIPHEEVVKSKFASLYADNIILWEKRKEYQRRCNMEQGNTDQSDRLDFETFPIRATDHIDPARFNLTALIANSSQDYVSDVEMGAFLQNRNQLNVNIRVAPSGDETARTIIVSVVDAPQNPEVIPSLKLLMILKPTEAHVVEKVSRKAEEKDADKLRTIIDTVKLLPEDLLEKGVE